MPEAKPIAIVYVKLSKTNEDLTTLQDALDARWIDYHVLVVPCPEQERAAELEVFYDKNFTDTNYEDLKKWITEYLNPPPTNNL